VAQADIEFDQGLADEGHSPVSAGQGVQDVRVEHEDTPHPLGVFQRVKEGGVVVVAQVASKPDQG